MAPELAPVSRLPLPPRSPDLQAAQAVHAGQPEAQAGAPDDAPADAVCASGSDPALPAVLTIDELAAYLRVNHKTIRDAIARGEIPGVRRLGTATRIHAATVINWLAKGQVRVSRSRFR
jgi:excisionase family DNA binding protein